MEDQLIITIYYETAPRADDLGELFAALARDYKDITRGRVLVVTSIEHGSIIATLTDWAIQTIPYIKDAVEFAKGAKALADFGKVLKDWIDGTRTGKKTLPQRRGRKTQGQRSIEAIVKIAADKGRAVRVRHTTSKGEAFEVEMSGPEAIKLTEETLPYRTRGVDLKDVPRVIGAKAALPDLKRVIDRLYEPSIELSTDEMDAIVAAIVEVLRAANLAYLIPQIVADLSNRGMPLPRNWMESMGRLSRRFDCKTPTPQGLAESLISDSIYWWAGQDSNLQPDRYEREG